MLVSQLGYKYQPWILFKVKQILRATYSVANAVIRHETERKTIFRYSISKANFGRV
jgi:hypothetical protein